MTPIAVHAGSAEAESAAAHLASKLGLPIVASLKDLERYPLTLEVQPDGIALRPADPHLGKPLRIDYLGGPTAFRRRAAGSTRQPLARAIGLRHGRPKVMDATAGLGRDAFQLASLGCEVTAIERSPVLFEMLADALQRARAQNDSALNAVLDRMHVVHADAAELLRSLSGPSRPDVIYLDPMYTPRSASALAKKEMRILRMLVGGDEDAAELLEIAQKAARDRVVVKRHLRAAPLSERVIHAHAGRTVRYDVYPAL